MLPEMWNVKFRVVLIFLVLLWHPYHPWLYIIHQLTVSWGKHTRYALNSAVPLPAAQPSSCLGCLASSSTDGVMAGCTLKLHTVFNGTQRGLNDFSIHQLQYNLSFLQSVAPRVSIFPTPFSLRFYIFGTCVSTGVSEGSDCDLALSQGKTVLAKG